MKGHFYRPNCKCPKDKKCKCGAKWGFLIDIGINPQTGKRKQKFRGGFKTKKEAEVAAASFLLELNNGTFVEEKNICTRLVEGIQRNRKGKNKYNSGPAA